MSVCVKVCLIKLTERCLPLRSYDVKFNDGTTRRRTSKHVRFSSEARLIDSDDMTDTVEQQQPPAGLMLLPRSTRDDRSLRPALSLRSTGSELQPASAIRKPRETIIKPADGGLYKPDVITTRSGRKYCKPTRYQD